MEAHCLARPQIHWNTPDNIPVGVTRNQPTAARTVPHRLAVADIAAGETDPLIAKEYGGFLRV